MWSSHNLWCKHLEYIQNFSLGSKSYQNEQNIQLKGHSQAFKIIHVTNLRSQKDHLTALKAIKQLVGDGIVLSYHLIGGYDKNSEYYKNLINFIQKHHLEKYVFIYGSQTNIAGLLEQADMALLSSVSEGLPVSLIEYAQAKLLLVVTDVGQCKDVVGDFGLVVNPSNNEELVKAITYNYKHPEDASKNAEKLY
ncbi:glycosyltransferase family 4 protein [Mesohalobacter halotolerans]|uniref:Glycosyltransferase family 4 protein n=1 Tax=Mesohalobacter halotolerans TaxID=1883405 RepID=A0A4U5TQQ7_9FLAO|nr:glycosyltransferase family 4 protein [Mesohalobacter halotolerans]